MTFMNWALSRSLLPRTYKFVKSFSISTVVQFILFNDYQHAVAIVSPTSAANFFEFVKRHVSGHVIVVYMSQIHFVLLEQNKDVGIVPDELLGNAGIGLSKIKGVHALVSAHCKISSDFVLFIASHVVENKHAMFSGVCRIDDCVVFTERMIAHSFDSRQGFLQQFVLWLIERFRKYVNVDESQSVGRTQ